MKKSLSLLALATCSIAGAFTQGNFIVAVSLANGAASLTTAQTKLMEFTPAGTLVGTPVLIPSSASDPKPFSCQIGESSECAMTLSKDGRFITIGGYSATDGLVSQGGVMDRAICRFGNDGKPQIFGGIPVTATGGDSFRNAYSIDGNQFWTTGGNAGVDLFHFGNKVPTEIVSDFSSSRYIIEYFGNLYYSSSDDNVYNGVGQANTIYKLSGVPFSGPVTPAVEFAFSFSPRYFAFTAADTLYVASTTGSRPGIQKYKLISGLWVSQGSSGSASGTLTSIVDAGPAGVGGRKFYAVRENGNELQEITDTGSGWTTNVLYVFPTNEQARSVAWVPQGKTVSGNIDLGDLSNDTNKPITIEIRDNDNILETTKIFVDPSGNFTFPTTVANGTYSAKIKGSTWLAKVLPIVVTNGGATLASTTLINGDVNGNNLINTDDYLDLSGAFDTTVGDAGYIEGADLDCNGIINTDDYLILSANFDQVGDE